MRNTILTLFTAMLLPIAASAQFYTITKETEVQLPPVMNSTISADNKGETSVNCTETIGKDTVTVPKDGQAVNAPKARKGDKRMSLKVTTGKSEKVNPATPDAGLPELTIPNLYKEIVNNGIRHPKIVLAQAILETGWFRSKVCRNRNNLFGLTNPLTGQYFEFGHWTESVRAYYTKVQYRYKGGNYLVWLRDIGYAEDPNYIREVIRVLKTL